MENSLRKSHDDLEKSVRARTRELESANQTLIQEIKERRRLETDWKESEFITNSAQEFMTLVNRHYVYEAVNDAYCNAQEKSRDEIVGKTMAEIWGRHKFNKVIKPRVDQCLEAKVVKDEGWIDFPISDAGILQ